MCSWSRKRFIPNVSPGAVSTSPETQQPLKLRRGSPRIQWVQDQYTPLHFGTGWNEAHAPSKEKASLRASLKENCGPYREPSTPCRCALTPPVPRTPNVTPQTLQFTSDSSCRTLSRVARSPGGADASGDSSSLDSIQEALGVLHLRGDSCSPEVTAVRPSPLAPVDAIGRAGPGCTEAQPALALAPLVSVCWAAGPAPWPDARPLPPPQLFWGDARFGTPAHGHAWAPIVPSR